MSGCITLKEVRRCKGQIIRAWGLNVYIACLLAKPEDTFLGVLMQQQAL